MPRLDAFKAVFRYELTQPWQSQRWSLKGPVDPSQRSQRLQLWSTLLAQLMLRHVLMPVTSLGDQWRNYVVILVNDVIS